MSDLLIKKEASETEGEAELECIGVVPPPIATYASVDSTTATDFGDGTRDSSKHHGSRSASFDNATALLPCTLSSTHVVVASLSTPNNII